MTEIFHSTRDVRKLLVVTMDTLKRVFPQDVFTLLLANDPVGNEAHSIRHFDLDKANEASMHVFVSGEMKCWGEHVLYAPLKGTQGIYGVLEVKLNPTRTNRRMQSDELKEEIRTFVKKGLAAHAAPREIEFRDKLPKTRSGKIMRRVLKAWELDLPTGDLSTMED